LEAREAKARAEPPAAGEQRKLCRPRIGRHPQQRGQLVRLLCFMSLQICIAE
jgi:hypothetical protein